MPLHTELEKQWAYYVPQEIPDDAVEHAPETVRELKILDPAVGSGHFLVVAFDLLFSLYKEEALHRAEQGESRWSDKAIVESILERNLHGIDLDARAVQIAAAALWLKAQTTCPDAHPRHLNLVASNLQLASLTDNDPALVELRSVVEKETGMPGKLTDTIVQALRGADHLGSLLQIDKAVDEAITKHETALATRPVQYTRDLFGTPIENQQTIDFDAMATRQSLLEGIERFLQSHTSGEDLGLRTRGKQLAAGVRFMRLVREGSYDLVVANPPYQGTSKLKDSAQYEMHYPKAKTDLFAGMTIRGLELLRPSGTCAMIALSNWMFLRSFLEFREYVLTHHLYALADLGKAAFSTGGTLISTACYVIRKIQGHTLGSVAIRPMSPDEVRRDNDQPSRAGAALLLQRGRYDFDPAALNVVPEWPLVYWWDDAFLTKYENTAKLGDRFPSLVGASTGDNLRFVRRVWEVNTSRCANHKTDSWVPYINGAKGRVWIEDLNESISWNRAGLAYRVFCEQSAGANFRSPSMHFHLGIAFTMIGSSFSARTHRYPSIFGNKGSSLFPEDIAGTVCVLNSSRARGILESLNPGIGFEVGDVNRLPLFYIAEAEHIFKIVESAFDVHEAHREPSIEYRRPGPSPWRHAQEWAQLAVDQAESEKPSEYVEELDLEPATDHLSFAIGVALGRFCHNGQGILKPNSELVEAALPEGILFLDGSLDQNDDRDSLAHAAVSPLRSAWREYGASIDAKSDLRTWLRLDFFGDVHKAMYENSPIHWPLSSAKKTFVAWINIHRWNSDTLRSLLADHLLGNALPRIDGELEDLRKARAEGTKGSDARFLQVQRWKEELDEFIALVKECAEKGPPPTDDKCPKREVDARYDPNLDDGVMINSAALWPLLEPQWKDPKKWWKELAIASSKGNKDYDWSHLAMRYFPKRVDDKCQKDPSLGVAHGCFWKYHPAKAWAWELRLQNEIAPDFRIEEASYRGDGGDVEHRSAYLRDHALDAIATIEKEALRRRKDAPGKIVQELTIIESGLWASEPEACWDMETRIIKKQEYGFRLIAPDEAEARAKLIEGTPQKETGRRRMLEGKCGSSGYLDGLEEAIKDS
jgi:hypothetical protein